MGLASGNHARNLVAGGHPSSALLHALRVRLRAHIQARASSRKLLKGDDNRCAIMRAAYT